ncbi:metallophosphoesterase [Thiorhodococcus minor]|uniref:Metallophosphoesterase n=1 Tax=Thiorhodococcus minor TaxID=57489 RepID=A0A6M0JXW6_9GAMM|nr:metallophosphoesterase [Thiorhodococcus minor]
MRIAHISDLHFGRHIPAVVAGLQEALVQMRPDLVALSGDLTQRAKPHELEAAAAFIASLPRPTLAVPGNHDLPGWEPLSRLTAPWRRWKAHLGLPLETAIRGPGYLAIGLKTARRWGLHLDWSRGRINATQLARAQRLASSASPGALRILVAHHPFMLGHAERHRGRVGHAGTALTAFADAGIDLLLGGHLHLGYAGIAGRIVVSQAGTATSSRYKGEPNTFNRIAASRTEIRVECMHWTGGRFAPKRVWGFRRGPLGWQMA